MASCRFDGVYPERSRMGSRHPSKWRFWSGDPSRAGRPRHARARCPRHGGGHPL